jgi:DnaJ domain
MALFGRPLGLSVTHAESRANSKFSMAEADLYKILDVSPSASGEKIRSAYRDLVKKYHPDLFSTPAQKASATERFRQINAAYAILGDPERRREYDKRFPTTAGAKRPAAATKPTMRSATANRRRSVGSGTNFSNFVKRWHFGERWKQRVALKWVGCSLAVVVLVFLVHAGWNEPEAKAVWMLVERTEEIQPSQSVGGTSPGRIWTSLGRYASKAECADHLKETVRSDEQQGSKAIWDERDRTIAITVYTRNEADLAEEYFHAKLKQTTPGAIDEQGLKQQASEEAKEFVRKNGTMKRVRNLECHQFQVPDRESWLRSGLEKIRITN